MKKFVVMTVGAMTFFTGVGLAAAQNQTSGDTSIVSPSFMHGASPPYSRNGNEAQESNPNVGLLPYMANPSGNMGLIPQGGGSMGSSRSHPGASNGNNAQESGVQ